MTNYLQRKELFKILNKQDELSVNKLINEIKKLFMSHEFISDDKFIICGRREYLNV